MKPFSLEEYLKNPNRKVVTRDGRPVRIVCTDRNSGGNQPVVALYPSSKKMLGEIVSTFCANGEFTMGVESEYDLFFAPEKHEGWTFFTKTFGIRYIESIICATREEAQRMREADPGRYGAIVKLEWEE